MSNFDGIRVGMFFKADGATYKKVNPQIYVDPTTGIETYWDPLFDNKIETAILPQPTGDAGEKYTVDPQTRIIKPNPGYLNAEAALKELFDSGLFNCEATNYKFMVDLCIKWGKSQPKDTLE
jgi:hypothetical protein